MSFLLQVLLLAGTAAISTSAAPDPGTRFPVLNETYIIVLREFQNYTGGPLPSTYNSSKAIVERFLRRYTTNQYTRRFIYYDYLYRGYCGRLYEQLLGLSSFRTLWNRNYPMVGNYTSLYIGFIAELNDRALRQVHRLPQVYFVEKDQTYNISVLDWHLDRIDERYLPLGGTQFNPDYTGQGVDIYILDSGIRYSHSEFGGRAVYGGFDCNPSSTPGDDDNGHGTHVAALAGGSTVGVARKATLYSIRMLGCSGGTTTSNSIILQALEHVVNNKDPLKTVIMSMSFGVPASGSINLCVNIAYWNGIIPVASAGNNEFDSCLKSPASAAHAFTVGATDRYDNAADFTNHGPCVNIFAPGVSINSASHESDDEYTVFSGTSMAAPLVSGAAALVLQENPSFTPIQVMSTLLIQSTQDVVNFAPFPYLATTQTQNRLLYVE